MGVCQEGLASTRGGEGGGGWGRREETQKVEGTRTGRKKREILPFTSWLGQANSISKRKTMIKHYTASYPLNNPHTVGIVHTSEVHSSKLLEGSNGPGCSSWRILSSWFCSFGSLNFFFFLMSDSFPTFLRVLQRLRMTELSWSLHPSHSFQKDKTVRFWFLIE